MATCPACSTENEAGFAYCRECGEPLAPEAQQTRPDSSPGRVYTRVAKPSAVPPTRVLGADAAESTVSRTQAFKADRSQQRAQLVRIVEGDKKNEAVPLDRASTTIGREDGDLRFPTDTFLSRQHARLFFDEGRLFIEDLGGPNGTYIRLRGPQELQFGDVLYVGRQVLRLDPFPVGGESPRAKTSEGNASDGKALGAKASDAKASEGRASDGKGRDGKKVAAKAPSNGDRTSVYGRLADEFVGCLSLLLQDGEVGNRYLLDGQEVVLGRDKGDIVFTRDQFISNDHVAVRYVDGNFFAEDLGSRNGTLLRIRKPTEVDDGDTVLVGQQLFRIEFA